MVRSYFTFGQDHECDKVPDPLHQFVCVEAPSDTDARSILLAWLGGDGFASEYTEAEFDRYFHKWAPVCVANIIVKVER